MKNILSQVMLIFSLVFGFSNAFAGYQIFCEALDLEIATQREVGIAGISNYVMAYKESRPFGGEVTVESDDVVTVFYNDKFKLVIPFDQPSHLGMPQYKGYFYYKHNLNPVETVCDWLSLGGH